CPSAASPGRRCGSSGRGHGVRHLNAGLAGARDRGKDLAEQKRKGEEKNGRETANHFFFAVFLLVFFAAFFVVFLADFFAAFLVAMSAFTPCSLTFAFGNKAFFLNRADETHACMHRAHRAARTKN